MNYAEFLNLLFSDSNHSMKKIAKKKFNPAAQRYDLPIDLQREIVNSFMKELEYNKYIIELLSDIKTQQDFSIQDLYYSMKSYSFITTESIKAFLDRNDVSYSEEDIRLIITRINIKKDGKICFNEFKGLFDLTFGRDDEEVLMSMSMSFSKSNAFNSNNRRGRQFECSHLSRSNSPSPNRQDDHLEYSGNESRKNTFINDNGYISEQNDYDGHISNNNLSNNHSLNNHHVNDAYESRYLNCNNTNDRDAFYNKRNRFNSSSYGLDTSNSQRMNKNLVLRKSPQRKYMRESNYN